MDLPDRQDLQVAAEPRELEVLQELQVAVDLPDRQDLQVAAEHLELEVLQELQELLEHLEVLQPHGILLALHRLLPTIRRS